MQDVPKGCRCQAWWWQSSVAPCRLPKNPVMNSPIVSVSVFSNHTFLRGPLDTPLVLEFRLLETANRSKPLCVQWNHSNP